MNLKKLLKSFFIIAIIVSLAISPANSDSSKYHYKLDIRENSGIGLAFGSIKPISSASIISTKEEKAYVLQGIDLGSFTNTPNACNINNQDYDCREDCNCPSDSCKTSSCNQETGKCDIAYTDGNTCTNLLPEKQRECSKGICQAGRCVQFPLSDADDSGERACSKYEDYGSDDNYHCRDGKCGVCYSGTCYLDVCEQGFNTNTGQPESGVECPGEEVCEQFLQTRSNADCCEAGYCVDPEDYPTDTDWVRLKVSCVDAADGGSGQDVIEKEAVKKDGADAGIRLWVTIGSDITVDQEEFTHARYFSPERATPENSFFLSATVAEIDPENYTLDGGCWCEGNYYTSADSYMEYKGESKYLTSDTFDYMNMISNLEGIVALLTTGIYGVPQWTTYVGGAVAILQGIITPIIARAVNAGESDDAIIQVVFDENEVYCENDECGNGIWDPDAAASFDLGGPSGAPTSGGSCCGDDPGDDPDMGDTACENCLAGYYKEAPYLRDYANEGNVPQEDRCCGDDTDDCGRSYGSYMCFDLGGSLQAAGTDFTETEAATDPNTGLCLDPDVCGGSAIANIIGQGSSGGVPGMTEPYSIIGSTWVWSDARYLPGIILQPTHCAQRQIVSDGSSWVMCTDDVLIDEKHISSRYDIEHRDIIRSIYSPQAASGYHDYLCYEDIDYKYKIAECCSNDSSDCISNQAFGKRSTTGESIETYGDTYYCASDFRWSTDLDDYEHTCEQAGYVWTGQYCCSEDDDQLPNNLDGDQGGEWYNDQGDLGACYASEFMQNDDYVTIDETLIQELYVTDGKFHGCAIDEDNANLMSSNERWQEDNQINKPYQGSFNYVKNGDFRLGLENWTFPSSLDVNIESSGELGMEVMRVEKSRPAGNAQVQQSVSIPQNSNPVVSLWAKAGSDEELNLNVRFGACVISGRLNRSWRLFTKHCPGITGSNKRLSLGSPGSMGDAVYYGNIAVRSNDFILRYDDCPNPGEDGCSNVRNDLVRDHAYCDMLGYSDGDDFYGVFCSYKEQWEYIDGKPRSHLSYIEWEDNSTQQAECCTESQCWTGTECYGQQNDNPRDPPFPHRNSSLPGWRCIDGEWTHQELKYTWDDTEAGFCAYESQCLVNPFSTNTDFSLLNETNFDDWQDNNIQCINSTQFIGDHYCENGSWTSRTKLVALELINYGGDDFTLFCGDYKRSLNYFDYSTMRTGNVNQILSRDMSSSDSGRSRAINNICVLRMHPGHAVSEKVIVGISLNDRVDEPVYRVGSTEYNVLRTIGKDPSYCDDVLDDDEYNPCYMSDVWYNGQTQSIMFSNNNIGFGAGTIFTEDVWDQIISDLVSPVEVGEFPATMTIDYDSAENTKDYSTVYFDKKGDKEVIAVMERVAEDPGDPGTRFFTYMAIEYANFDEADLCSTVTNYSARNLDMLSGELPLSCEELYGGSYMVQAATNPSTSYSGLGLSDKQKMIWKELTSKLRVKKE